MHAFNGRSLLQILQADVVHIHHLNTVTSAIAAFVASVLGKRIFVTDYGGGTGLGWKLNQMFTVYPRYHKAIAYSMFGKHSLPDILQAKTCLIKGGIDTTVFCPNLSGKKANRVLYVGRILPHKGIDYLIDGFKQLNRSDYQLWILGRVYDAQYYQDLIAQAAGLNVQFIHDADDQQLLQSYQTAKVTVLPSVHRNCYGSHTPVPELMGFTLLESQACGTPVICTDAGAMAEFVCPGVTGSVVPQNSGKAIASALEHWLALTGDQPSVHRQRCCDWVQQFSWNRVVEQHLKLYGLSC